MTMCGEGKLKGMRRRAWLQSELAPKGIPCMGANKGSYGLKHNM